VISHVKTELGSNIQRLCVSAVSEWCDDWHCCLLYFFRDCTKRNMPYFRSMLLRVIYVNVIKHTYIQSWTGMKSMVWEKCDLLVVPWTVPLLHAMLPTHCSDLS